MGRMLEVEDYVPIVLLMISDYIPMMTGANIRVTGGEYI